MFEEEEHLVYDLKIDEFSDIKGEILSKLKDGYTAQVVLKKSSEWAKALSIRSFKGSGILTKSTSWKNNSRGLLVSEHSQEQPSFYKQSFPFSPVIVNPQQKMRRKSSLQVEVRQAIMDIEIANPEQGVESNSTQRVEGQQSLEKIDLVQNQPKDLGTGRENTGFSPHKKSSALNQRLRQLLNEVQQNQSLEKGLDIVESQKHFVLHMELTQVCAKIGKTFQAYQILKQLINSYEVYDIDLKIKLNITLSKLCISNRYLQEALNVLIETVTICETNQQTILLSKTLLLMGYIYSLLNYHDIAQKLSYQGLQLIEALIQKDSKDKAFALFIYGFVLVRQGGSNEKSRGATYLQQACDMYQELKDLNINYYQALNTLACELSEVDPDEAIRMYEDALEDMDQATTHYGYFLNNLAQIKQNLGMIEESERLMKQAISIYNETFIDDEVFSTYMKQ